MFSMVDNSSATARTIMVEMPPITEREDLIKLLDCATCRKYLFSKGKCSHLETYKPSGGYRCFRRVRFTVHDLIMVDLINKE